jgi:hypothetical protein
VFWGGSVLPQNTLNQAYPQRLNGTFIAKVANLRFEKH